jgi:lycopene beta-cyclase
MTNYPFPAGRENLVNIGTAGGHTKGSSGYTFQYIQKNSQAMVKALALGRHPSTIKKASSKFSFYDSVLLHILHHRTLEGSAIFTRLFKKNTPEQVFKFLDNETSLVEDLHIMRSLPTIPFAKAALRHLFH